jgi:SAM-dependent methyltransferase
VPGSDAVTQWSYEWLRLNAVCPYYTMFPLDFPLRQMELFPEAERILDPFCGRGTTLYAARLAARTAVGVDISPVAVAIAQAKTARAAPEAVVRMARNAIDSMDDGAPEGEFWTWAFHNDTLREIAALRGWLLSCDDSNVARLLRAIVLGSLHGPRNKGLPSYLSNQMPRTYAPKPDYAVRYWREHDLVPVRVKMLDLVRRRAHHLLDDSPPRMTGRVLLGDAATVVKGLRQRFDLVITSPPYYGMRTYVADQWLRNWFVGGVPEVPYGTHGQLARQRNQEAFVAALAEVWSVVARKCAPRARLAIRFGALPSSSVTPEKLITASLDAAKAGWIVTDVRPAGIPARSRRQAAQFNGGRTSVGQAVSEVDVLAELTTRKVMR